MPPEIGHCENFRVVLQVILVEVGVAPYRNLTSTAWLGSSRLSFSRPTRAAPPWLRIFAGGRGYENEFLDGLGFRPRIYGEPRTS